eukprot:TRINITY_DN81_c0_g1_i1.p1 TRINITY_DN81_c0_g1~~TRINITY_DN81_c0_g1_i1.p1  ORF type:complete len:386 (-),score=67.54 TRINITY_DN81_c0_g1_i1:17-1174(-)
MSSDELSKIQTMRDVFDYCTKNKLHSVAQGMIELPPPRKLREIVSAAILDDTQQHINQYRNRYGEPPYLQAIQTLLEKHYNTKAPLTSILATAGVTGAIVATLMMLRKRARTRIALIEPFYTYHSRQCEEVFGFPPDAIPTNPDFSPNWTNIENRLKQGLDGIILCNPGNPTGRVWSATEQDKLVELCTRYDCLLIIDEIYCDMIFNDVPHYSPINKGLSNHVVVCRGFSKTLAAQSWRLGYAVSSETNIAAMMAHHDPIYISVTWQQHALAQYLDTEYEDFANHCKTINQLLRENWKVLYPAFHQALGWDPIEPQGTMYGMFKHHQSSDLEALQKGLACGVGVAPASMFYGKTPANTGFIRIHVGMTHDKALAIAATLAEHTKQ